MKIVSSRQIRVKYMYRSDRKQKRDKENKKKKPPNTTLTVNSTSLQVSIRNATGVTPMVSAVIDRFPSSVCDALLKPDDGEVSTSVE